MVVYDDTETQLNADNVQTAIKNLKTIVDETGGTGITTMSAEDVEYNSEFHNVNNDVKAVLDGLLYLFGFVNLYINGGQSSSTHYTGSFINGGSSVTTSSPNAIMDAGYSQDYNES